MLLVLPVSEGVASLNAAFKFAYVASLVVFGIFSALFQIMDFQTTVMGIRNCYACESNPVARSLYAEGGAQLLYQHTLTGVSHTVVALLFGLVLYLFAEALPVSDYYRYLLYGLSFIAYGYLLASAIYHLIPVYDNLWTLYYFGVGVK